MEIEINSCSDCPFLEEDLWCTHPEVPDTKNLFVISDNFVWDKCPLLKEDVKLTLAANAKTKGILN